MRSSPLCGRASTTRQTVHWHSTAIPIDPQFASQWNCRSFFKPQTFSVGRKKNSLNSLYSSQREFLWSFYKYISLLERLCGRVWSLGWYQWGPVMSGPDDEYNAGDGDTSVRPGWALWYITQLTEIRCDVAGLFSQLYSNSDRSSKCIRCVGDIWYPPVVTIALISSHSPVPVQCSVGMSLCSHSDVEWEQKPRFISDWDKAGRRPWETSVKD